MEEGAPRDHGKRRKGERRKNLIERKYVVRAAMRKDILLRLHCGEPDEEISAEECLAKAWSRGLLYWCCPPFRYMAQVVNKLIKEKVRCILLAPW